MTDETLSGSPSANPSRIVSGEFIAIWAESIAQVLSQIAGSPLTIESLPETPPEAPSAGEGDVHTMVAAAGALRGEMSLCLPRAVVLALAQLFLGEPQDVAAEFRADHKEAVEELLRQIAGHVATALKPSWGEVQLQVEAAAPPSWPPAARGWLRSTSDTPCSLWMEWQISAALLIALEAASASPTQQPTKPTPEMEAAHNSDIFAGNLDLLMDVELEVMLRFGERSMRLQEILELGAGSVVELDRKIEEPADLLLDGRVIARGEVVVVDGNYGLRVLEIVNPQSTPIASV
jgi:flagellar motor switch protein FliN